MLSVISFTWFDIFILLMMLLAPVLMGFVTLFLLVKSASHSGIRSLFLWLVLPQILTTLIFWLVLDFYNVYTSVSIISIASGSMLGGVMISYLLFRADAPVSSWILFGHIISLALFFITVNNTSPNLLTELQAGRDRHLLLSIGQNKGKENFNRRLENVKFRQEMLSEAVNNSKMPEATFRELLARGADAFQTYNFNGSIFSTAVAKHNLNAVRVFTEKLDGDDKQAKSNREFLRADNPLDQPFYFSSTPTEEQKKQYMDTAKIILDKMPELLSDEVYYRIIPKAHAELIQFLWDYHPPEKPVYRIQAEALLGMVTVADKIAAAPGILKEKPAADYANSLWEYLVQYAPRAVIQSILERSVVQWADYKDKEGNNPVLEEAIGRAKKYTGDDPQVLTLVMRDILAHGAAWSPSQLAHGFYTEEEGSHVVSSLHSAGITCTQLREALSNFVVGSTFDDGEQRIKEACQAGK
ncbi:hypothetical protein KC222_04875 [Cedecea davisae]|uniref:MFS transporter n=1 Tax=Cedecea davisae TaxID=158484 RepID=A0ABS6DDS4_9ENTR|nr:hypothetical protein [Cedecea davisae]MBU4681339.1 hypothetical protein [Cedecea davisae]MBU4686417.1 hypothetical protein [Cedecea davisae]